MKRFLVTLFLCFSSLAGADGMPGPWPFPWARKCPVRWESLEGRYILPESSQNTLLDLKVSVVDKLNFKLVRVSRFDRAGNLEASGLDWVAADQQIVRLWLYPFKQGEAPTWAVLKMHYASTEQTCDDDHLVAILTLEQADRVARHQTHYRLIRADGRGK